MGAFNRLPGYRPSPPGFERSFLRRVPALLFGGSLLAGVAMIAFRIWPPADPLGDGARMIDLRDAQLLTLLAFYWFIVLVMALAAFIVIVMKGPAYVADAYPLSDAERPARSRSQDAGAQHPRA